MKIDWKKAIGLTAAAAMLLPLAACGGSNNAGDAKSGGIEDVTLSVWAPQEDQDGGNDSWLSQVEANFEKEHPEYKITWKNDCSPRATPPPRSRPTRPPPRTSTCSPPISSAL